MKVEIAENWGEAAIICYVGPEEVKVTHKEAKLSAEGQYLDEIDVMVALLDAASAAVGSIPHPELPPLEGGETPAARKEREEKNRKELEEWTKERERIEAEEDEALLKASYTPLVTNQGPQPDPGMSRPTSAPSSVNPPEPAPEPQVEPQPQEPQPA
jgi:hypothetical protein